MTNAENGKILVLGIGNILMGDEGVGVHVVRELEKMQLPANVELLDGGTGAFVLLEPMQRAARIILIDATIDNAPPGSVRCLTPHYARDYPPTLTAHDIGLKDLLDVFYLSGRHPDVTLFAISIAPLQEMSMQLSPAIAAQVPHTANLVMKEITPASR